MILNTYSRWLVFKSSNNGDDLTLSTLSTAQHNLFLEPGYRIGYKHVL